jgi:protein-S-isoprenylcysteine O-methyltransferase
MGIYALYAALGYMLAFFFGQKIIQAKFQAPSIPRREPPGGILLILLSTILMPIAVMSLHSQPVNQWLVAIGCGLAMAGALFSWWAQWELGRNWVAGVALRKGHRLITSGPYRYVRHPMYTGILFSSVGLGLCSLNFWFFGAMLALAGSLVIRYPMEDLLLRKKFSEEYPAYATTTGALFPRMRRRAS